MLHVLRTKLSHTIFLFSVIFVSLMSHSLTGQQIAQSNLYNFNLFNLSSSYAGLKEGYEIRLSHFNQWGGIENAPVTNYISAHGAATEKLGIGGRILYDQIGFMDQLSARASFSYIVPLADADHNIRLGLSAGIYRLSFDFDEVVVEDPSDLLVDESNVGYTLDNEFSVLYFRENFHFTLSIPQIYQTSPGVNFGNVDVFSLKRHYLIYSSYLFDVGDKWKVQPSVLFKSVVGKLNQIDFNGLLTYDDVISVGGSYRTHSGPIVNLGLNLGGVFIGGSYEMALNNSSINSDSFQVMLGFSSFDK